MTPQTPTKIPADTTATATSATSHKKNSSLTPLSVEHQNFSFIEYFLRLNLKASTAKIVQAQEINNPNLTVQFERRSKDMLILDSWIELAELESQGIFDGNDNTDDSEDSNEQDFEERLLENGFPSQPPPSGIKVSIGSIPLGDDSENGNEGIIRRKMILCKVAVGRAYATKEDVSALPPNYDSFILDQGEDLDSLMMDGIEDSSQCHNSNKKHSFESLKYVLKDGTQILPTYLVSFELDKEEEKRSRQKSNCDNCETQAAVVWCQSDSANLCHACDRELHSSKLTSKHHRISLEGGPQAMSVCRSHPDKMVEFFCPTCSKSVCVHCKMVGHHSSGEASKHRLISVSEAYKGVKEASDAKDPLLEKQKAKIEAQSLQLTDRARLIEKNAEDAEKELEIIYKKTLEDIRKVSKSKLNILRGDMSELAREHQEIARLEHFLLYQREAVGALTGASQFILDWGNHQKLRTELHGFPLNQFNKLSMADVVPDIKVQGSLQVLQNDNHHHYNNHHQRTATHNSSLPPSPSKARLQASSLASMDFSSLTKGPQPSPNVHASSNASVHPLAKN